MNDLYTIFLDFWSPNSPWELSLLSSLPLGFLMVWLELSREIGLLFILSLSIRLVWLWSHLGMARVWSWELFLHLWGRDFLLLGMSLLCMSWVEFYGWFWVRVHMSSKLGIFAWNEVIAWNWLYMYTILSILRVYIGLELEFWALN